MPKLGTESKKKLDTVHPDLKMVIEKAIEMVDFTVLEGHRPKELQNLYFSQGKSKLPWPKGEHNKLPSHAVDVAPYPIDWKDIGRFSRLAFFIQGVAFAMGIKLRLGADWNGDFVNNESFLDAPHLELESKLIAGKWVKYA